MGDRTQDDITAVIGRREFEKRTAHRLGLHGVQARSEVRSLAGSSKRSEIAAELAESSEESTTLCVRVVVEFSRDADLRRKDEVFRGMKWSMRVLGVNS